MTHTIYLALGTNIGDRFANLGATLAALPSVVRVSAASPIYETEPWGYSEQPAFLNQVISAETQLEPLDLLAHLKRLEIELGRTPTFRYGPRLIDMDILFYDNILLSVPGLEIPHPRLPERPFVLVPLVDLAPDFRHPRLGKTLQELLAQVDTNGVRPYE